MTDRSIIETLSVQPCGDCKMSNRYCQIMGYMVGCTRNGSEIKKVAQWYFRKGEEGDYTCHFRDSLLNNFDIDLSIKLEV